MKIFVTGVGGQLGHDVVNELASRGHRVVGSDIAPQYSGIQDGSAVCSAPYVQLDITDAAAVETTLLQVQPDAVIHCAAWTAVDAAEDDDKQDLVRRINAVLRSPRLSAAETRRIYSCLVSSFSALQNI